ncbi:hypothetical protein GA0070607_3474 [Micromonospora coriariae]|uniref:Uncharacterized protein n=1 Tax=Micromonospora coriariae TaxID=285665 RepID=A0A1C4WDB0_9ACTN|nr:hypothetical protein [Micromonospora coriariae]SCE94195.1 hypothetical protein GA0070607_3474 [Micromonospora coriariae]
MAVAGLTEVWLAVHGAIATVVDSTTLADLLTRDSSGRAPTGS